MPKRGRSVKRGVKRRYKKRKPRKGGKFKKRKFPKKKIAKCFSLIKSWVKKR